MTTGFDEHRGRFEELLFHEAALLDSERFDEWLEMIDDAVRYFAPVRATLPRDKEILTRHELVAHFDDNKAGLAARIRRIRSGWAHAEEPPSRTRHFISNVRVLAIDSKADTAQVASNFIVFRSAGDRDDRTFFGTREDLWRKSADAWRLLNRIIIFDHNVIESISVFF
ncbi:MAG TPA: aromatic-ring-hydroxylating dioxygenase subunit beta [Candidatus Binataceae bacterium]|nr:aromatic-ring-hydroxylating dioxygenase subunit beta [Candidatus Binataceae bacterium]